MRTRITEETAIIGAGPYGLSIAAHLRVLGVRFRIFGKAMQTWRVRMPRGMFLKSEGFASSLCDPKEEFTLKNYCLAEGIPYADLGMPVALETFTAYGSEFQKKLVPELDEREVSNLDRTQSGYTLTLDDGSVLHARRVVIATGISHFQRMPDVLTTLAKGRASHSSSHNDLRKFGGSEIAVIGAGASALDLAAILRDSGASVHLVSRGNDISFHLPPSSQKRSLLARLRAPMTGLGPSWRSFLCVKAPLIFHQMPVPFRLEVVKRHLGPAGCWFMRDRVVGHVPFHLGSTIREARESAGKVLLQLERVDGYTEELSVDHVIAATGYDVLLHRLPFLGRSLHAQIRTVQDKPILSPWFACNVPGLYFVGPPAATAFGPLMRFVYGTGFTARRLSRHLARS